MPNLVYVWEKNLALLFGLALFIRGGGSIQTYMVHPIPRSHSREAISRKLHHVETDMSKFYDIENQITIESPLYGLDWSIVGGST
jgi:hypothetical protein